MVDHAFQHICSDNDWFFHASTCLDNLCLKKKNSQNVYNAAALLNFYTGFFPRSRNNGLIRSFENCTRNIISPAAKEHPQLEVQHQGLHEPPLPEKISRSSASSRLALQCST